MPKSVKVHAVHSLRKIVLGARAVSRGFVLSRKPHQTGLLRKVPTQPGSLRTTSFPGSEWSARSASSCCQRKGHLWSSDLASLSRCQRYFLQRHWQHQVLQAAYRRGSVESPRPVLRAGRSASFFVDTGAPTGALSCCP